MERGDGPSGIVHLLVYSATLAELPPSLPGGWSVPGECRFCGSRIHSHDKRHWAVTGDLDLDELGSDAEFIAVIDREDGMVIARVPLEADLPKAALKKKLKELREHYLTEPSEADFSFVVHQRERRWAAAH